MMSRSIQRIAPTFALALLLNVPLFVSSGLAQEVVEQVLEEGAVEAESLEVETSAELLRLRPRFRGNFDSESGGIDPFVSADAFFPVLQDPGSSTFYFNPKLRFDFDNDSTVGGNLIFGYRNYSQERDRILGGYLSFDVRDTGDTIFPQIGFGFERLGRFDIRANGYVPIGDTSQVVDRFETGFSITDSGFQGQSLQITAENTIWEDSEVALGGFDIEAGGSIFRWQSHGNLELFGGVYYLGGDNVSAVGGRGRVALTPTNGIQLGVGVQGDEVFGTRVFFNATAHLPHPKVIAPTSEEEEALAEAGDTFARLDDPVARIDSVVVDTQRDSETLVVTGPALNPETGEAWVFTHVIAGGNSDGSFEDPFATVQEGLDATTGDGNDIVYVRLGNDTIPAFTIPDNVRVISAGPEQLIDLQVAGIDAEVFEDELLPESGTGDLPLVVGTVTMGNSTLLSGFDIQPQLDVEIDPQPAPGDPGILARSVSDFTITDNEVSTIDANGIELDGDIANGEILNNTIAVTTTSPEEVDGEVVEGEEAEGEDDSSVAGIFMSQTEANLSGVTISENDITVSGASGSGIIAEVTGVDSPASTSDLTIASNTISVTTEETDTEVRGGNPFFSVTSPTSAGIEIDVENAELSDVTIADNEIAFSGPSGSGITSQLIADGDSASIDGLEIANNSIDVALAQEPDGYYGGTESGISTNAIAYNGGTANLSNLTITGNTITGEADSQFTGVETNVFAGRFNRFSGEPEEATETSGETNTIETSDITIADNTISSVSGDRSTGVATNIYAANNRFYFGEVGPTSDEQSASIHLDRTTISGNTISTEAGDRAAGISTNIIALNFNRYGYTAAAGANISLTSTDISGNTITSETEGDEAVGIEANVIAVNFNADGLLDRELPTERDSAQSTVTLVDTTITGNTIASQAIEEAAGIGISTTSLNYSSDGRFLALVEEESLSSSSSPANVTLQNTTIDGNEIENEAINAYGINLDSSATDRNPFFGEPPIIEPPDIAEVAAAEITTDANASVVLSNTTITNNTITNVGDYGVGIEITGDDTPFFYDDEEFDGPRGRFRSGDSQVVVDRTTISGNTIAHTTDPSSTAGILVSLGGRVGGDFTLQDTEISGNTITGNGPEADGIIVEAFGEYYSELKVANSLVAGNTVELTGSVIEVEDEEDRIESSGIVVSFTTDYGSELTASNTIISDNSVVTFNSDSVGIELFVEAGDYSEIALTNSTISGNEIATDGERADGIAVEANAFGDYEAYTEVTLNSTTISGNTVVTRGDYAAGVIASVYSNFYGYSQIDVTISNNTIDTFGNYSPGILVEAYGSGRDGNEVTITGNTVATRGDDSSGIVLEEQSGADTEATLSSNTVTTQGNDTSGIEVSSRFGSVVTTISNNVASVQDDSTSFLLESDFLSSVCADLTGNTSTSSGLSFDLGIFENGPGSSVEIVGFTDFPALSADNNNSFVDITGDTPDSVVSCSAPR